MSVFSIKCPNCGGELVFEPSSQNYVCPYCNSSFSQAELDRMLEQSGHGKEQEGNLYSCPSCGAQIVTDETTAATFCYYCHNPVVLEGRISGAYLPDRIIPFKISREEAVSRFLSYVGKKKYVPKAFFNKEQIDKLSGVYYPYWVFDTDVEGELTANGTRIKTWRVGDTEYTQTSIYDVRRQGMISIDQLTRNALKKTAGELVENVQPYTMADLTKFSMGYLSGFMAEKRDIEKDALSAGLRDEAGKYAKRLLEGSASEYTTLKVKDARYMPSREQYSYVLLPVWVLTYRSLAGKFYYYAMNGQTGTIAGELPIDMRKLVIHCLILGLVIILLALAASWYF